MTLTEFLLARIKEDEADPWVIEEYGCPPGCCAPAGYVGHRCLLCRGAVAEYGGTPAAIEEAAREHAEDVHHRPRVLAECRAKRQIIEAASRGDVGTDADMGYLDGLADAVAFLATAYASHPDYNEAWRP